MSDLVGPGSRYTDDQRREAAVLYAIKGSLVAVEKVTGIPNQTLSDWRRSEWWNQAIAEAQADIEDKFRAKCHQIVDKATDEVLDRIENGNEVHTKQGIKRIKVSAGELSKTGGIFYDKYRLSMNLPTSIAATSDPQKMVAGLAEMFNRISEENAKQVKDAKAIEGESREIDEDD